MALSALQCVILACQRRGECGETRLRHFQPAAIKSFQGFAARNQVQCGATLAAVLHQQQAAVLEIERRKAGTFRYGRALLFPMQPAQNHQMDDGEVFTFEFEYQALADA